MPGGQLCWTAGRCGAKLVVMNKRKLHHWLVVLRPISYWYFVGLFLLSVFVTGYALRQNNLGALELRDQLYAVDKQNGDIETALRDLREYTYAHMNTNLASDTGIYPPIQLKYHYDRLVAAELKRVESANQDVYNAAQKYCEAQNPTGFFGATRLGCVTAYIDRHGRPDAKPRPIQASLYTFDFVSPSWSSDLAGWSMVLAVVSLFLLISRILAQLWLKHALDD
jgi:hypothetical protein